MVKVNIHGRKIEDFTISGDGVEVATEIGVMLERIHSGLYKANPRAAEQMKQLIICLCRPDSPVWRPDDNVQGIFAARRKKTMDDKTLLQALRRLKVETGSLACLGCGHEHNCDIHGCAIIREAAERIESLLMSGEKNK